MPLKHKNGIIAIIAVIFVIILSAINLFLVIEIIERDENSVHQKVIQTIQSELKNYNTTPKDGSTPIKGIDYKDGVDGAKGLNGYNGTNGTNGVNGINGENGKDGKNGLTPELRCNTRLNRWEYKYTVDESWSILNDSPTICTILMEERK